MSKIRIAMMAAIAAMGMGMGSSAYADSVLFSNPAGPGLTASANFTVVGTTLTIVLTNTSTTNVGSGASVLTGLFWTTSSSATLGGGDLGRGTAVITSGSSPVNGVANSASGNISSEWAFSSTLPTSGGSAAPGSFGIGASGFSPMNWFGQPQLMSIDPGKRLSPTNPPPDGTGGGIVNAHYTTAGSNSSVTDQTEVSNSVTFTFAISSGFSVLDSISNIKFAYGTGSDDLTVTSGPPPVGSTPSTPLPSAVWGGGALMAGLAGMAKLRRRKA